MTTPGQQYRSETITIGTGSPSAPTRYSIEIGGDWIYIPYAQSAVSVSFDGGPGVPIWSGCLFRLPFSKFAFVNTGSRVISVNYIIGRGEPPSFSPLDERVTEFAAAVTVSAGVGALTSLGSSTQAYRAIWVSIPDTEAGGVTIGNSSSSPNHGVWLPKGLRPIRFPLRDGLYVYNNNVSAVSVYTAIETII